MTVPGFSYTILYNGKNITKDISENIISITYTDKEEGESDELEISIEDSEGLWLDEWFPVKGDKIEVEISDGIAVLKCGVFEIDEPAFSGSRSGATVSLKGLAAGVKKNLRSKKGSNHENKTLREIANTVASRHGFKVQGIIPNITIGRSTQRKETDLEYLRRISYNFGLFFSVRNETIIFTSIYEIEKGSAAFTLFKEDLLSYSITDKTTGTYKQVKQRWHNPAKKKVINHEANGESESSDVLEINHRAENEQQAEAIGKAALHRANSITKEGSVSVPGNLLFVAGNNFSLQRLGKLSGKWHIKQSTHTLNRGGYTTDGEIKFLKQ